jgi:late competence protein required for DNA uptake (superfamily II DNA/RNA helicase)
MADTTRTWPIRHGRMTNERCQDDNHAWRELSEEHRWCRRCGCLRIVQSDSREYYYPQPNI